MLIRALQKNDIAILAAMDKMLQEAPWSASIFYRCLLLDYPGWVIVADQQRVGYGLLTVHDQECHILTLGIAVARQRQGLGNLLLRHMLNYATLQSVQRVYLEVSCANPIAIRLYEKNGFSRISLRKNYYKLPDRQQDAWVYVKDLTVDHQSNSP